MFDPVVVEQCAVFAAWDTTVTSGTVGPRENLIILVFEINRVSSTHTALLMKQPKAEKLVVKSDSSSEVGFVDEGGHV